MSFKLVSTVSFFRNTKTQGQWFTQYLSGKIIAEPDTDVLRQHPSCVFRVVTDLTLFDQNVLFLCHYSKLDEAKSCFDAIISDTCPDYSRHIANVANVLNGLQDLCAEEATTCG